MGYLKNTDCIRSLLLGHGGLAENTLFNRVAVQNVSEAMATKCENQHDYKSRADTILKGKETVLGKSPETAVQVRSVVKMTREELLEIARG